ncbi:MAG: ATP-dependent zinc metalloprotease FtsH [Clostridiales bacterium]|jgi:cell division protease FtsH|nr:ATP-dependent zinc metalloprotease FtsH [Clostridiales bacterium]
MKNFAKGFGIYVLMVAFLLVVFTALYEGDKNAPKQPYIYSGLIDDVKAGNVRQIEITGDSEAPNAGRVRVWLKEEDSPRALDALDISSVVAEAQKAGVPIDMKRAPKTGLLTQLLPIIIMAGVFIVLIFIITQQSQGGGRVMSFGRIRVKQGVSGKQNINFASVAGLEEEKRELTEIVDFLKNPKKFTEIGARIPKGVLLVGPPGTGKTMLAKAVAGEAGVPFFSISGSDFVEMFVGVGASRVRDLFEQAKRNLPSIVFIDEIDAVGRRRGAGLGGGHDEREQTLNQLLVEMDGFGVNEGVIIMAATNRPDILDPALLRPGRFDRQVVVGKPDINEREQILKVHAQNKKMSGDADLRIVAQTTSGFTGADLENLLNEAALLAVREESKEISPEHLRRAFVKLGVGTEKKSRVIKPSEKRVTAYHEAGHAIIFETQELLDHVHIVSIIPTGMALGYAMPLPTDDKMSISKKYMEQEVVSLLGGRAAEYIVLQDITTGASNDIERATAIARKMVTKYGMSDRLGPIQFGADNEEIFIGRDLAHTRNYGEEVAAAIDAEIKRIVEEGYQRSIEILRDNLDTLHAAAALLIEKEKISGDDFRSLFPEGKLPKKEIPAETILNEKKEEEQK